MSLIQAVHCAARWLAACARRRPAAAAQTVVGVTATEIKIGNTNPYSGPASAYGTIGKAIGAYFKKVNDEGGDQRPQDQLHHLRRRLQPAQDGGDGAASWSSRTRWRSLFQTLGTPPNTAIHKYMNQKKVPHLFVATGATKWNDPKNFPWTMGWQPNYQTEGRIYAEYILKNKPDAKIGILYQNDDYGKDYLKGFEDGLGDAAKKLIVMKQSYEVTDPDDRLADRQPQEQRRQRVLQHHDPEVRGAGDQEGPRHRLEAAALPEQRVELARHRAEAGRARGLQGPDHRALHEGDHRPAVEERQGLQGLGRVHEEVLPGGRARRPVQRLRLQRGAS